MNLKCFIGGAWFESIWNAIHVFEFGKLLSPPLVVHGVCSRACVVCIRRATTRLVGAPARRRVHTEAAPPQRVTRAPRYDLPDPRHTLGHNNRTRYVTASSLHLLSQCCLSHWARCCLSHWARSDVMPLDVFIVWMAAVFSHLKFCFSSVKR